MARGKDKRNEGVKKETKTMARAGGGDEEVGGGEDGGSGGEVYVCM